MQEWNYEQQWEIHDEAYRYVHFPISLFSVHSDAIVYMMHTAIKPKFIMSQFSFTTKVHFPLD